MKIKPIIFTVVVLVVLLTVLFYFSSSVAEECRPEACVTASGAKGVNACIGEAGKRTGCILPIQLGVCNTKDGKLIKICSYENDKLKIGVDLSDLKFNQIIILDINLQRAALDSGLEIEDYIVCDKTDIKETDEIYLPPNYEESERFKGLSCSPKFNVNDYHHLVLYGFLDKTGKVNLAEVYLFEQDFGTTKSFYENLDKGDLILDLEVDI